MSEAGKSDDCLLNQSIQISAATPVGLITDNVQRNPFLWQRFPFPLLLFPLSNIRQLQGERRGEENGVFCLLRRHQPSGRKAAIADWGPLHSSCPSSPLCSLYIPFLPTFSFLASNLRKPPLLWRCRLELELRPSVMAAAHRLVEGKGEGAPCSMHGAYMTYYYNCMPSFS